MEKKPFLNIKTVFVFLVLSFQITPFTSAQFSSSGITLENTYGSAVNWVDIDGDGDLDLSISGYYFLPTSARGKLYINNGSTLVFKRDIRLMSKGDQSWSDFNNDGFPELLYAGTLSNPASVPTAGIDKFDHADPFNPSVLSSGFTPVSNASVDWGDYDNDGDYDALISGEDAAGNIFTRIYQNNNAVFTEISTVLPGVIDGKVAFIDYDLDQDLDIFICGKDINTNKYTRLWKNTGGVFSITNDLFINLKSSYFDWSDFDNDGYPDLLIVGFDDPVKQGILYKNNSGNSFTQSIVTIPASYQGSAGFGDVDNDGDQDLFISGVKDVSNDRFVFINDGAGSLTPTSYVNDPVSLSFFQFGDWNSDNKLDFVVNGYKQGTGPGLTVIANNSTVTANTKPTAPQNLISLVEGRSVYLKWDPSTDNNTPQKALTYNIYMGTATKGVNIVSPNASTTTGIRIIARPGYIQDTVWALKNLPVGIYYWGVQAIDNSLGASLFSDEGTFEIKDRFDVTTYTETPSVSSPALYMDCDHDNDLDMFINYPGIFYAVENKLAPFSQADYKTILATGYDPIKTITPNDYDNDNLIDFSISGNYSVNGLLDSTIVLFGYNSPFNYSIINDTVVKNLNFEYVLWADFNNDGKQDLVTSGKSTNLDPNNKPATYILKNMGNGTFQKAGHYIRGFEKCGAVAGDYDNDMDIDFLVYGKDSLGVANTYMYVNQGDFNFTENLIPDNELYRAYLTYGIQTGDFDLNGELDFYMAGANVQSDFYARVLLNHNMVINDANLPVRSSPFMSNYWADYDYDGDLDIFSTSLFTSPDKMRLYLNNNGVLTETTIDLGAGQKLDLPLIAANLDNKNGLDFLMKRSSADYLYYQYSDNWGSNTRLSSAPANTGYVQDQLDIVLHWDRVADCPGCTYNIRIGTQADNVNIMSPMSDLTSGYRYVVQPGNTYLNNGWRITGLPVGTYHWSVQSVDQSNTGGPWAPLTTFTVTQINAEFSFNTVCNKETTQFNDLSVATNSVVSWSWDFGDGTVSTLQNPGHIYTNAGTYTVGLWAWSQTGESAFKSHTVTVKAVPVTGFTSDVACQGTSTTFTNTTDLNGLTISNWLWNFGDGLSSTSQNPDPHGYLNAGDYTTELWAFAANGCNNSVQKTVKVGANPSVAVTADAPLTFCEGGSVTLSLTNTPSYTYQWKLDGNSLTNANSSSFIATQSGIYTVEVINPVGNCTKTSDPKSITVNPAPASPLINTSGGLIFCEGDSVQLSVTGNPAYAYQWKLNGGAVGTNSNQFVVHAAGTYSLVVTNSSGCISNSTNTINVTVNSNPVPPTVSLSGPTSFCQGGSLELSVTNNPVYTYQWENNGSAISGAVTNLYVPQNSGEYLLKITNSSGCSSKTEKTTVNILTTPVAPLISASGPIVFCQDESVDLSVVNTTGYLYDWKLNGGAVGTNSNQFKATNSGRYILSVSNASGCSVYSVNYIDVTVNSNPILPSVNLSGATSFCEGGNVTLSVTPNSNYSYTWRNGSTTVSSSSVYTANTSGVYQLDIVNSSGCITKTAPVDVTVKPMPSKPVISALNYSDDQCPPIDTKVKLFVEAGITGNKYQWFKNGIPYVNGTLSYLEDYLVQGDYTVETDLNGCKMVSDNKNIRYTIAPEKPTILVRGPVVWYMATSKNSYIQYKWYFNDELIQGATKYIYVANKKLGTYRVEVADDKCFTSSDDITIPVAKSGMTDFKIPAEYLVAGNTDVFEDIKIYPNPTHGLFTIEMDNDVLGELNISIITQEGKKILRKKFEKITEHFSGQIDLSDKAKGLYFINMMIENFNVTRKLVVE